MLLWGSKSIIHYAFQTLNFIYLFVYLYKEYDGIDCVKDYQRNAFLLGNIYTFV